MPQYSQPNLDNFVRGSFAFGRIKQFLTSAGDIFESSQSAKAFALGPDSDIARVNVAYVDPISQKLLDYVGSIASNMAMVTITPERGFSGFVPSLNNSATYTPGLAPGRILMWPSDLYDSRFLPSGYSAVNDTLVREDPVIDIIEYFEDVPSLQTARSDKQYVYDTLPFGADDCFVMIPVYGRRRATIVAQAITQACDMTLKGVNFRLNDPTSVTFPEIQLDTDNIAAGAVVRQLYNAETDGAFDFLILQFSPTVAGTSVNLRVTTTDKA